MTWSLSRHHGGQSYSIPTPSPSLTNLDAPETTSHPPLPTAATSHGQIVLEKGLGKQGLAALEKGQTGIKDALSELGKQQASIKSGWTALKRSQPDIEAGHAEVKRT